MGDLLVVDGASMIPDGTVNVDVRYQFNTVAAATTIGAGAINGRLEIISSVAGGSSVTPAAGTLIVNGSFNMNASAAGNLTWDATVNNPNMAVTRDFLLNGMGGGTEIFNAGSGTYTIGGVLAHTFGVAVGTFNAGTSAFIFTGAGTVTLGPATFFHLGFGGGKIHTFESGMTYTVGGIITSFGTAANRSVLVSDFPGTAWLLNISGWSTLFDRVDVTDSDASGGAVVYAVGSVDGGGNANWIFVGPVVPDGKFNQNEAQLGLQLDIETGWQRSYYATEAIDAGLFGTYLPAAGLRNVSDEQIWAGAPVPGSSRTWGGIVEGVFLDICGLSDTAGFVIIEAGIGDTGLYYTVSTTAIAAGTPFVIPATRIPGDLFRVRVHNPGLGVMNVDWALYVRTI